MATSTEFTELPLIFAFIAYTVAPKNSKSLPKYQCWSFKSYYILSTRL